MSNSEWLHAAVGTFLQTLCSTVECDISMYTHTHTHMWRSDFVLYEGISLVLAYKMHGHAPPTIKLRSYTQIKAYWLFYGCGIRNGFNFCFFICVLSELPFFGGGGVWEVFWESQAGILWLSSWSLKANPQAPQLPSHAEVKGVYPYTWLIDPLLNWLNSSWGREWSMKTSVTTRER